jgi:hypothetical protein
MSGCWSLTIVNKDRFAIARVSLMRAGLADPEALRPPFSGTLNFIL